MCPNHVCFNCECIGHEARDCLSPVLCCICKEEGHMGINCTYSRFCSTVSICQEMDVGNSGTPVTIVNEMPATDLNNEMPEYR